MILNREKQKRPQTKKEGYWHKNNPIEQTFKYGNNTF